MPKLNIFDRKGKKVGTYNVEPTDFAPRINKQLLHDAVVMYQANERQGSHQTKSRGMVAGSTKKTNIVPEELRVDQRGDTAIVTFNVHNPSAVSRRTFVWRWERGAWRIVHLHASNK